MKEIIRRINLGRPVLLFLDYDGTLVSIQKSPGLALLPPSRRRVLKKLSKSCFVGIVSGRPLAEIKKLVALREIAYIGNHGLEISYRQRHWVHPDARRKRPLLSGALEKIKPRLKGFAGVLIEDKGLTASIHYRLAEPASWRPLRKIVRKEVELGSGGLKMTEGKRVIEIKPSLAWDKGEGVRRLIGWVDYKRNPLKIYIGDDKTDEDAFKMLNRSEMNGLTVLVGRKTESHARYRLADVGQVWTFLGALLPLTTATEGSRLTI